MSKENVKDEKSDMAEFDRVLQLMIKTPPLVRPKKPKKPQIKP
jgi:hypothetical protein